MTTKYEPPDDELFDTFDVLSQPYDFVDHELVLAKLLVDGVLFVGDFSSGPFWESHDVPPADITTCVWVNCNDVFEWACADCEPITQDELAELYRMHKADKRHGSIKWACKRRNMQPQRPLIERMKERGVWCELMESLPKGPRS